MKTSTLLIPNVIVSDDRLLVSTEKKKDLEGRKERQSLPINCLKIDYVTISSGWVDNGTYRRDDRHTTGDPVAFGSKRISVYEIG